MLPRAATSPELALLRTDGQWSELLACIPQPAVVYTARVNGAPAGTDLLTEIAYDTASGTLADVLPGMTLLIGTSAGASDRGQARVRKAPTSSILYIGTESEIDVQDNDFLTVLDEFGLWEKRVKIEAGVTYMDEDVVYSNQNAAPLPVVIMGGPAVLELRGPTVTAHFDASASWVPGGGAATYLWAAPGASATASMTAAIPTITYNAAGRYRVACTVTIGGVANTRYEYVEVLDSSRPPTNQLQVRTLAGSKSAGGYSFQMTLYDQASRALVRDRAQVILFTRDHFGSSLGAPGYATGRENILCVGWIDGETIQWSPELSSVTFQVEGAHAWLQRINAYPQGLEDVTAAPAQWVDFENLTVAALVWCLVTWRSTVAAAIDVYAEPSPTRVIELSAAATSLWEQLQVTAGQRLMAPPCTDHLSRLFVLIDLQLRADRSGVAEVMTLTKADYRPPIPLARVTVPPVAMVDSSGFSWDGTVATALFSLSPGRIWKRYGRVLSQQALLLDDQAQANTLCGLIAGQANNEYPSVPIQLAANNRMFDIAPDCYALLTLAAGETPRGLAFTGKRLIPRQVSWNYDPASGGLLPTVTFEAETFAQLAVTGDAPATEPIPPVEPPPDHTCPTGYHWDDALAACVPDVGPAPGDGNTVFIATDTRLARTHNALDALTGGTVNWVDLTTITPDGSIVGFCLYSYDPVNYGLVVTTTSVYILSDLNTNSPTWTLLFNRSALAFNFAGDPLVMDTFDCIQSPISSNDTFWLGVTAHNAHITAIGLVVQCAVNISLLDAVPKGRNVIGGANGAGVGGPVVRRIVASFSDGLNRCYAYSKYGDPGGGAAAYTLVTNSDPLTGLEVDYVATFGSGTGGADGDAAYPDDAQTQYFVTTGGGWHIWRSISSGHHFDDTVTEPISGAAPFGDTYGRLIVNIATQDEKDVLVCLPPGDTEADTHFYRTTDGGFTWLLVRTFNAGNNPGGMACGRWPYDPGIVYFLGDSIYFSPDMLTTIYDLIGDWVSVLGAWPNTPVNIIPEWLAI